MDSDESLTTPSPTPGAGRLLLTPANRTRERLRLRREQQLREQQLTGGEDVEKVGAQEPGLIKKEKLGNLFSKIAKQQGQQLEEKAAQTQEEKDQTDADAWRTFQARKAGNTQTTPVEEPLEDLCELLEEIQVEEDDDEYWDDQSLPETDDEMNPRGTINNGTYVPNQGMPTGGGNQPGEPKDRPQREKTHAKQNNKWSNQGMPTGGRNQPGGPKDQPQREKTHAKQNNHWSKGPRDYSRGGKPQAEQNNDRAGESRHYPQGDTPQAGPEGTEHLFQEQLRPDAQGENRYYDQQDVDPNPEDSELQQQEAFRTYTKPVSKNEADFSKTAPKWFLGKSMWYVFMEDFYECGEKFMPRQCVAKSVLYSSVVGEAKKLIAPHMNPKLPKYRGMTVQQYSRQLQAVFEPVADAARMRIQFVTRKQQRLEHASKYTQHKLHLFLMAYPQEYPPWSVFYEETLNGLINSSLANEMRRYRTTPINNVPGFKSQMERIIQAMQGSVLAGQLKPTELVGIEIDVVVNPNNYNDTETTTMVRQLHALEGEVNALKDPHCYFCNESGHRIQDCPRKMSGMQPSQGANSIPEQVMNTDNENSIEAVGRRPVPYKLVRKPPSSRMPVKRRKIVSVLETEDGTLYEDWFQRKDSAEADIGEETQINTMDSNIADSGEESEHGNGFQDPYTEDTFLGL